MKVSIIKEEGYDIAMFGLGLSHGLTSEFSYDQFLRNIDLRVRADAVAQNLAHKGCGHNKFLETMQVWLDIDAPRYFWQEFDTYRVGTSKQSESTMHTIKKRALTQDDFDMPIGAEMLVLVNALVTASHSIDSIKNCLPEGFLQRRIISTNYKTLQNIYKQLASHKLQCWKMFCIELTKHIDHPEFIADSNACGVG